MIFRLTAQVAGTRKGVCRVNSGNEIQVYIYCMNNNLISNKEVSQLPVHCHYHFFDS